MEIRNYISTSTKVESSATLKGVLLICSLFEIVFPEPPEFRVGGIVGHFSQE